VLKGISTHYPINIIKNVLEDVNTSQNGKLWLVLQDMKKAYDSVSVYHSKRHSHALK